MRTLPPIDLYTSRDFPRWCSGIGVVRKHWLVTLTLTNGEQVQQEIAVRERSMAMTYAEAKQPRGTVVKVECVDARGERAA